MHSPHSLYLVFLSFSINQGEPGGNRRSFGRVEEIAVGEVAGVVFRGGHLAGFQQWQLGMHHWERVGW